MMERRYIPNPATLKKRDEGASTPLIVGYGAVFYREGDSATEFAFGGFFGGEYVERIMPTAFDKAIQSADVRALFNHDANQVLGRRGGNVNTLKLSKDERGLAYEIDPPNSPVGQTVLEALRRGDVTGSSFSFVPTQIMWIEDEEKGRSIREIHECELFDVGPVTFPAYEGSTSGIRAIRSADGMEEVKRSFEAWKASQVKRLGADAARARARLMEMELAS